ncbi:MAG: hypothetical protein ABRQ25_12120 [Clostridiaceae bacterium]
MDTEKNQTSDIENNILNEQDTVPEAETSISDVENNSNTEKPVSKFQKFKKFNFKKINFKKLAPVLIAGVVCFGLGFGTSRLVDRNKAFTKPSTSSNDRGNIQNKQFNDKKGNGKGNKQNKSQNNTEGNNSTNSTNNTSDTTTQ